MLLDAGEGHPGEPPAGVHVSKHCGRATHALLRRP